MQELRSLKGQIYAIIVFLLLLIVAYIYLVQPLRKDIDDAKQELAGTNQEIDALEKAQETQAKLSGSDRIALDIARRAVPEAPYEDNVIRDMRRLEVVSGMNMKQYNISAGAPASAAADNDANSDAAASIVQTVKIETSFVGEYGQIDALFKELESLDRVYRVNKLSFNRTEGKFVQLNATHELIVANVALEAYFSPTLVNLQQPSRLDYSPADGKTTPFY
ncbi:hypothetical protein [Cohnella yongneupensis]|uniref:Type IV pilus assembly protein PilO n=1 Tax=Cohnella yongneupensis TaxID=425006 RepID=A0ABW0R2J7_9BACL